MTAYYNEFDPHAADWLENLIREGVIAHGIVDRRDIRDVEPRDLDGFVQCHFFAGIGVWSYALRLAGWPDDRPVWTGSCPCQPFSAAGKGNGFADERHLWPAWQWLIEQCRPDTIFGEQVASKDGLAWFDLVLSDMEGAGYAVGVQDTCAAGVGAPHIRQRLFFVADAKCARNGDARFGEVGGAPAGLQGSNRQREWFRPDAREPSALCSMADSECFRRERGWSGEACGRLTLSTIERSRNALKLADAESIGLLGRQDDGDDWRRKRASGQGREVGELGDADQSGLALGPLTDDGCGALRAEGAPVSAPSNQRRPGPTNGFWRDADWLGCTDGKWRPVEPGSFPLVDGSAFRLGSGSAFEGKSRAKMLKCYGNAINAEVARNFIEAYLDCEAERLVDIFS